MSFNMSCLQSLDDYNRLTSLIDQRRQYMSFWSFTNKTHQNHQLSPNGLLVLNIIKIILYVIMITVSLFGNLLIMLVIAFNRSMRKSTNYFIFNLAVCDLAILFSCVWVQIVTTIHEYWVLGRFFCKLNSFMQMVSVIASVLTLSLISCDRYFGIVHPFKARVTSKRSSLFISLIWVIAILISVPVFIFRTYTESHWADFLEKRCDDLGWPKTLVKNPDGCILKTTQFSKRIYYTAVILFLFFLPILIMSITYSIIIYKMWKSEILGERVSEVKRNIMKRRKRVIIMLIWILVVFFVCWSPLESMLLFMEYADHFPEWFHNLEWISYFMAYSNAAINPFIYAGLNANYKEGIKKLLDRMLRRSGSSSFLSQTQLNTSISPKKQSMLISSMKTTNSSRAMTCSMGGGQRSSDHQIDRRLLEHKSCIGAQKALLSSSQSENQLS